MCLGKGNESRSQSLSAHVPIQIYLSGKLSDLRIWLELESTGHGVNGQEFRECGECNITIRFDLHIMEVPLKPRVVLINRVLSIFCCLLTHNGTVMKSIVAHRHFLFRTLNVYVVI